MEAPTIDNLDRPKTKTKAPAGPDAKKRFIKWGSVATVAATLFFGARAEFEGKPFMVLPQPTVPTPDLSSVPSTEIQGQLEGNFAVNDAVADAFAGSAPWQKEVGLDRNNVHGFSATVRGQEFDFVGTDPVGSQAAEWWFDATDPTTQDKSWVKLTESEMPGQDAQGQTITDKALTMPDGTVVLTFPGTLASFLKATSDINHSDGLTFYPPPGSPNVPDYDPALGKGILLPMLQLQNSDKFSAENIFNAIEFRTGNKILSADTATAAKEQQTMELANQNFTYLIENIRKSPNPKIAALPDRLADLQKDGRLSIAASVPTYDADGNPIQSKIPLTCGYDDKGNFLIIVNSEMFAIGMPQPIELPAASLIQCVEFQNFLEDKLAEYHTVNPDATMAQALQDNPDWVRLASLHSWFVAVRDALAGTTGIVPDDKKDSYCILYDAYVQANGVETMFDEYFNTVQIQSVTS